MLSPTFPALELLHWMVYTYQNGIIFCCKGLSDKTPRFDTENPLSVRITCMLRALIRSCRISNKQQLISRRAMSFNIEERGSPNTLDYRVYYSKLSFMHTPYGDQ